mgnify:CR=1 FL=1
MSYVKKNLSTGEEIIYTAKIHWIIYINGLILTAIGLGFIFWIQTIDFIDESLAPVFTFVGGIIVLIGALNLLAAFIKRISTELVVTSMRVIAKFGLIRRNTVELNYSKIESIEVSQSIFQRIVNSGTLVVNGTGQAGTPIPNIDEPLVFRNKVMEIIDKR